MLPIRSRKLRQIRPIVKSAGSPAARDHDISSNTRRYPPDVADLQVLARLVWISDRRRGFPQVQVYPAAASISASIRLLVSKPPRLSTFGGPPHRYCGSRGFFWAKYGTRIDVMSYKLVFERRTGSLEGQMSEAWEMFESYVEFVYQSLLDLGNDNVVVARDVTLTGRTGIRHQIDVYYRFEKAGFSHRVAIECRNKSRAIDKDQVMAFKSKVEACLSG
jgi:hypothetical protein